VSYPIICGGRGGVEGRAISEFDRNADSCLRGLVPPVFHLDPPAQDEDLERMILIQSLRQTRV
jgi:hypothetical protein